MGWLPACSTTVQRATRCWAPALLVLSLTAPPLHPSEVLHEAFSDPSLPSWRMTEPAAAEVKVADGHVTLKSGPWAGIMTRQDHAHAEFTATVRIEEPSTSTRFFGESWSAWPDPTFSDGGFDAALLLRSGKDSGLRVQLSHRHQVVALVKWPEGGHVQVVPCVVKLKSDHRLVARVQGPRITVSVDGEEKLRWHDTFLPLASGAFGLAAAGGAKAAFSGVAATPLPAQPVPPPEAHAPQFSVRRFLGGRLWVFDGDEPVLLLHDEKNAWCFAKLRPGYKPQINFDTHWGLENQGAFKEAESRWTAPQPVAGSGGRTVKLDWSARHVNDRFTTHSTLTVGFNAGRGTYTYDISSELVVLPGGPFHFRYGYDFEHHTPLDPFRWQYLVARRKDGGLYHRPVYPIDPGPQYDLEGSGGVRLWFGRHVDQMHIAPAVEYDISGGEERKLNTAVCAAFYDTGVSFPAETAAPGTRVKVHYRYTGWPAAEAEALFRASKIYGSPMLDPQHHYIFADEWPKLTFSQFMPMSRTWIYGRTPFMTGHNRRPTYGLVKHCGAGSGFAMKLGPASYGRAALTKPAPLGRGRYAVSALVKSGNVHGPGGRIEVEALEAKTGKVLASSRHFVGRGTFGWQRQGFLFTAPEHTDHLALALGNAGTGEMLVTDVEFRRLDEGEALPAGIAAQASSQPASSPPAPQGAIADFRMEEGRGFSVMNYAGGPHLDLANVDFVTDGGRPALRFADSAATRKDYRRSSPLDFNYSWPGKDAKEGVAAPPPVAIAGLHGGGETLPGLTLAAWIKPDAAMGRSQSRRGDILGYGARRFILSLHGEQAPYGLAARINVSDTITSSQPIEAGRWQHVTMTASPKDGHWLIRLFVDGRQTAEGMARQFPADAVVPPSIILGAEIFYLHDAYYRGLIGHTCVIHRTLTSAEIGALAGGQKNGG